MPAEKDFFVDGGAPAFSGRGRAVLDGLQELLLITLAGLDAGVFRDAEAEPGSLLQRDRHLLPSICTHLCLSYLFTPARAHYGPDQASVLIDVLFWQIFDRLPKNEVYQRYIGLRLFPSDPETKKTDAPEFSRPIQFAIDVTGKIPGIDLLLVIQPLMLQLMLDAKLVLESDSPKEKGQELAKTLLERAVQRIQKLDQESTDPG